MKTVSKLTKSKSSSDKYIPYENIRKRWKQNPRFRATQKDLELEFQLIDLLIDRRLRQNITQKDLADRMGTKQSVISRMERGDSNITIGYLKRLAKALDAKLEIKIY